MHITQVVDTGGIIPNRHYDTDKTVIDWLISEFGPDGPEVPIRVFHTQVLDENELVLDGSEESYDLVNKTYDRLFVVHNPLGIETAIIASIVISVAVAVLVKPPEIPVGSEQALGSPNNGLSGQTNIARLGQRIPEIFGEVTSYPDLIAPSVFEYVNNIKQVTEYFCVGRGFYDIQNVKAGVTLIDDIESSTFAIYDPNVSTPTIRKVEPSGQVSSLTLVAPNTVNITFDPSDGPWYYYYDVTPNEGVILAFDDDWIDLNIGESIIISGVSVGDNNLIKPNVLVDGTYTIKDKRFNGSDPQPYQLVLDDPASSNSNWNDIELDYPTRYESSGGGSLASDTDTTVGPYTVPQENQYDEIWFDVECPQGLASGTILNQPKSVDVEFFVEETDSLGVPTGPTFTFSETLSGSDTDPLFFTFKYGSGDGIVQGNYYRASARRTSAFNTGARDAEKVVWTRLASKVDVSGADTAGTTRIFVETISSDNANVTERELNCEATRKTVTWNGSSVVGDIDTGVGLAASRKFADALLHYFLDPALAALPESALDIQGLYDIQNELDALVQPFNQLGECSLTFDNPNTPAIEEMRIIANTARTFLIRNGSFFTFSRDEVQSVSANLFNRRNKVPNSEQKSIKYNVLLENDGIEFSYFDREDNENRTINLPQDLPAGDPNLGLPTPVNAKKIDGEGIRNYQQAWNRAQYELNRLIYRRVSVSTVVTAEGAILDLNQKISHVDNTAIPSYSDGEIIDYNQITLQLTLSEPHNITSFPADLILRNEDGSVSSEMVINSVIDEMTIVLPESPPFAVYVRGDNSYQRGMLYSLFPSGDSGANEYLVQQIDPQSDMTYKLDLINYSPEYYQADGQLAPPK
jgi:hypothetical protein